jgi:hypothetical protein
VDSDSSWIHFLQGTPFAARKIEGFPSIPDPDSENPIGLLDLDFKRSRRTLGISMSDDVGAGFAKGKAKGIQLHRRELGLKLSGDFFPECLQTRRCGLASEDHCMSPKTTLTFSGFSPIFLGILFRGMRVYIGITFQ